MKGSMTYKKLVETLRMKINKEHTHNRILMEGLQKEANNPSVKPDLDNLRGVSQGLAMVLYALDTESFCMFMAK